MNGKPVNPGRRRLLEAVGAATGVGLVAQLMQGFTRPQSLQCLLSSPIDRRYFGMHIHGIAVRRPWLPHGDRLTEWPATDFGTWRLWDAYVAWPNLQPHRDRWDFSAVDNYVSLAADHDVEIVLPLGLTPDWASKRPYEKSSYKPGNAAEPTSFDDWRAYVRTVAERYKGRIKLYEIWNEINLTGFYSGSLETMVNLVRIAFQVIKQIDPEARLVSPSVTGDGRNPKWLDRYLALGGGQYADVIGYHFYVPRQSPEAMLPLVAEVRAIMQKHGVGDKPLWNTESGWWIDNFASASRLGAAGADWRKLDQGTASAYVARALILGWASGLSRFCWYAWDNSDMGLYDVVARVEKPAARAYTKTALWLIGSTMHGCDQRSGVWICELSDAEQKRFRIVWRASGGPASWTVPASWKALAYEPLGGESGPLVETLALGQQPVMIR